MHFVITVMFSYKSCSGWLFQGEFSYVGGYHGVTCSKGIFAGQYVRSDSSTCIKQLNEFLRRCIATQRIFVHPVSVVNIR